MKREHNSTLSAPLDSDSMGPVILSPDSSNDSQRETCHNSTFFLDG